MSKDEQKPATADWLKPQEQEAVNLLMLRAVGHLYLEDDHEETP